MSLHNVYCSVCHKHVEVSLAGHVYEFMDWSIECLCEEKEEVVVKNMSWYEYRDMPCDKSHEYGLFNICDLIPSVEIIQEIRKKQGKPPIEIV